MQKRKAYQKEYYKKYKDDFSTYAKEYSQNPQNKESNKKRQSKRKRNLFNPLNEYFEKQWQRASYYHQDVIYNSKLSF